LNRRFNWNSSQFLSTL